MRIHSHYIVNSCFLWETRGDELVGAETTGTDATMHHHRSPRARAATEAPKEEW